MDIEELQIDGKCKNYCPYYYSHVSKRVADIIICPYQFLLDQRGISKLYDYDLENDVNNTD